MIDEHKINDWECLLKLYPDFEFRFEFYYREILYLDALILSYKSIIHDDLIVEKLNRMPAEIQSFFRVYVKNSFFESIVVRFWKLIFDKKFHKERIINFLNSVHKYSIIPEDEKENYKVIKNKLTRNKDPLNAARCKIAHGKSGKDRFKRGVTYEGVSTDFLHKILLELKESLNFLSKLYGCEYGTSLNISFSEYVINVCEEAEALRYVKLALKQDQWSGNKMREKFYKDKEILLEKELRSLLTI